MVCRYSFLILTALIFVLSITYQSCKIKNTKNSNCKEEKLNLLLDNVLKKRFLFPLRSSLNEEDSSEYFNWLYIQGLPPSNEIKYLKFLSIGNSDRKDSIKLRIVDTLSNIKSSIVRVLVLESNDDSTKIKLLVGYNSSNNIALTEATYEYSFDTLKCKWNVIDSTYWQY